MLGVALQDSLRYYARHWKNIFLIVLPISLPADVVSALASLYLPEEGSLCLEISIGIALALLVGPVYQRALILYVTRTNAGQPVLLRDLWAQGVLLWRPMFVLMLLSVVAIFGGLLLMIVPGIIIGIRLSLADIALVSRGGSAVHALRSSWQMTEQVFWPMLAGYVIFGILVEMAGGLLAAVMLALGLDYWWTDAIYGALYASCFALLTVFACRVYDLLPTLGDAEA